MLQDALIAMIVERGWDDVSVQDVCEKADVGRSTFYTHFADKEELLLSGLDELRTRLLNSRSSSATGLRFLRGLIEHVQEQQRLATAVMMKRSETTVHKKFRSLLLSLVREELQEVLLPSPNTEVTAQFLSGAIFSVLSWWIDSKMNISAEEIEKRIQALALPVLEKLQG
jgi:AcrR family transcriptional regulator